MAPKYLRYFPKPLLSDLLAGRWLPVVGAGMSLNAAVPRGKKMPLWGELGKALADELSDFIPNGALDAISAYEHEFGRAKLIEKMSDILLLRDAQPGIAHKEFCSVTFDIVCTTNFDFLLEKQYDLIPAHAHPVVDEDQLSINLSDGGTLLLKLHGDLRHPTRLVASEADYDGFLTNYPLLATYLSNLLITRTAVFVGYSLDDPDFRQILHVVNERLGHSRRMRYAIMVNASAADIKRFERRGVQVINLPGTREKYGEVLAAAFRELREYMRDNLLKVSQVKEEEPLRELRLPRDAQTRLFFCAVPLELLSLYRQKVFPAIEEAGFVPVTADDIVTPGDNVIAKIDSLIDRSSAMLVELGTSWTKTELQMALARLKSGDARSREFQLIVVVPRGEQPPADIAEYQIIIRDDFTDRVADQFVATLSERLRAIAPGNLANLSNEPERLLVSREYRAAVIAAMTLLEAGIRTKLEKSIYPDERRRMSMRNLLDRAASVRIINNDQRNRIERWSQLRNAAVHTPKVVSKADAEDVVRGVLEMLAQLNVQL